MFVMFDNQIMINFNRWIDKAHSPLKIYLKY